LWRNWWNRDWQGKPKYSEKNYPSALPIIIPPISPSTQSPGAGTIGGRSAERKQFETTPHYTNYKKNYGAYTGNTDKQTQEDDLMRFFFS
jgi:hypothetical protein